MEDYLKSALEIVKAQASVRTMTEDEINSMIAKVAAGIQEADSGSVVTTSEETTGYGDPKKAIKEKSVTCLECGKAFKVLTRKHLATHGLTPEQYREKYGYKKGQALVCKALQRERSKKMQDMKLWERRGKATE